MAISNGRQRMMPRDEDRKTGQKLDYAEAVLLTNPIDPSMKGEVDYITQIEAVFLIVSG